MQRTQSPCRRIRSTLRSLRILRAFCRLCVYRNRSRQVRLPADCSRRTRKGSKRTSRRNREKKAGTRPTPSLLVVRFGPGFFDSVLSHWSLSGMPQRIVADKPSKQPLVPSVLAKAGNVWRSPPLTSHVDSKPVARKRRILFEISLAIKMK